MKDNSKSYQRTLISSEEENSKVKPIVLDFLNTKFEGGRHINRINKIKAIEEKQCK